jgi:DNA-binding transcriptional regulator YdaS (Cro superfamily)
MNPIKRAVTVVGGASVAARLCGVSARAINKWVAAGKLPRTEYTGETQHAENLAKGSSGAFTAEWLKGASAFAYQMSSDDRDSTRSRTSGSALEVPVCTYSVQPHST